MAAKIKSFIEEWGKPVLLGLLITICGGLVVGMIISNINLYASATTIKSEVKGMQLRIKKVEEEKADKDVLELTLQNINKQYEDIKKNTDQIPEIKADLKAHLNQGKGWTYKNSMK